VASYYGPSGRPLGLNEWATLFELRGLDPDDSWWRRRSLAPGGAVSTVWLGIDHSFGSGPPLYWETMFFGCYDLDEEMLRHPSRPAAFDAHRTIVRWLWLDHAARVLVSAAVLAVVVIAASLT
jgi:hypothetical protein